MNHNPYLPPSAIVADKEGDAPSPPKPKAVIVAQVMGAIFAAILVYKLARAALAIAEWQKIGFAPTVWYVGLGLRVALLLVVIVMLLQLPKRSQIGRWCGVILILVILTLPFYLVATVELDDTDTLSNVAGYITGFLITFLPIAYWLYAFAFSRKARAYFRSPARN